MPITVRSALEKVHHYLILTMLNQMYWKEHLAAVQFTMSVIMFLTRWTALIRTKQSVRLPKAVRFITVVTLIYWKVHHLLRISRYRPQLRMAMH